MALDIKDKEIFRYRTYAGRSGDGGSLERKSSRSPLKDDYEKRRYIDDNDS